MGCTGEWHRSFYIAQALGQRLAKDADVLVRHREIEVLDGQP
ncbi:RapZ C-terminal domain-containing protein [Mycoavidus cysteinexigens]